MVGRARIVCIALTLLLGFAARAQDAPAADSLAVAADSVALPRWPQLPDCAHVEKSVLQFPGSRAAQDLFYAKLDSLVSTGQGNVNVWHVGGSHVQAAFFPNRIMNLLDSLTVRGDRGFLFPYKLAGTNYDRTYLMTATGEWEAPILTQSTQLRRPRYGVTGYGARTASPDASVSFRLNPRGDSLWCCESLRVLGYGSSERAYPYIICLADTLRFDFEPETTATSSTCRRRRTPCTCSSISPRGKNSRSPACSRSATVRG